MKKPDNNPRSLAVTALVKVKDGAYSNLQLNHLITEAHLNSNDVNLLTTIVYGVIQHDMTLDFWLKPFIKNPKKVADWVFVLLKTAVYQWQYLERVPKRAIFDETIKIAKQRGHEGIRRFVTGVLHTMDRNGLPDASQLKSPVERLAITYSMPEWLIQTLNQQLGETKTNAILATINRPANQSIRVNTAKITDDDARVALVAEGYEVKPSLVADHAFVLSGRPASHSKLFKSGAVTIQDESAMLPAQAMEFDPSAMVLDACAAPGGKTGQLAERIDAQKGGTVVALDIHAHKIRLIQKNAERLGVSSRVTPVALDARKVDEQFEDATFEAVLVDAPCSGIGLIRRKPEIRYGKQLADSQRLAQVQLDILNEVAKKVKINGIITYSTCTILNQENRDVVAAFLDQHPDFQSVRVTTAQGLKQDRAADYLEIYPDDYGSDGFFISQFKRVK
ncbi:16S rRNA (cytosine(967)-C(5))-methyltransferase RsmB [Secundilactobacillus kimchicus]|uniref:16S rRNA (cytosine(967)-C(5))-methyltransferase RsmB n=1 Tax=Secundilactobacillus kimchicus TaxID=528209 RepID=UPI0024A83AB1|nr:16S rRNA (cytosine(967)-C(5))-methyltransferase RsmB [Secundilactobacillus kimchicus]